MRVLRAHHRVAQEVGAGLGRGALLHAGAAAAALSETDRELEAATLGCCRPRTGTICPSDAASAVGSDDWRP